MPSALDQMNPTELLASAGLLLVRADSLQKDDPKAVELLQGAKRLLDLANSRRQLPLLGGNPTRNRLGFQRSALPFVTHSFRPLCAPIATQQMPALRME
jgi:hypothetical protein